MATIEKRGDSYRITVSAGYNSSGKQIRKKMTWKPPQGMTKKQIEKELAKQAILFEQQVETGQFLDGTITFAEFADRWFKEYAEKHLKETTLTGYKDMMPRIIHALGHIRLAKLQPRHLMEFYNNLSEKGIRKDTKYKPCDNFKQLAADKGYTQKSLSEAAAVSLQCVRSCMDGRNVSKKTADKISAVLNIPGLFEAINSTQKLSGNTISKYHCLISTILTTAVHWQVIPSNPCRRVKPPRADNKEAAVLDDEQVQELIKCLNDEPMKYKTAIMLILYTGLRRGELCGLNWSDIDLDKGIVYVARNLLYTPGKGLYEDTTKTKQSQRAINIPDDMVSLLKLHKQEQNILRLSMGDQWQDSGKVFTSDNGSALRPDTFSARYKKFVRRHNLPDSHIHTLRHVSATLLIAGGVDIATVSSRLGHANKTTTLNIYTHAIKSADAAAAEKLQDIFNPTKRYNAI